MNPLLAGAVGLLVGVIVGFRWGAEMAIHAAGEIVKAAMDDLLAKLLAKPRVS